MQSQRTSACAAWISSVNAPTRSRTLWIWLDTCDDADPICKTSSDVCRAIASISLTV
jgi:hypothetical protein